MRSRTQRLQRFANIRQYAAALGCIALLAAAVSRQVYLHRQRNAQIRALEADIATIEADNAQLSHTLDYLRSDVFLEDQARLRLGKRKPGEGVAVIQDERGLAEDANTTKAIADTALSNPQRWWRYFFASGN